MQQFTTIASLREALAGERRIGRRIALVPTMGALHTGHLSLVEAAARAADHVVLSIFVNPLQFGANEDLSRYPRDLARDRDLAAEHGVDTLFVPEAEEMYSEGSDVRIVAGELGARWEGAARPGHFDGVLTVVGKLFNIVGPDVAVFGQKDIQQVTLVQQMVRDLDFEVRVLVEPIARDADGLALSSRNAYLTTSERSSALALSRALRAAVELWRNGEAEVDVMLAAMRREIAAGGGVVVDYIAAVDPRWLTPVMRAGRGVVLMLAARVGTTRLIDNAILGD